MVMTTLLLLLAVSVLMVGGVRLSKASLHTRVHKSTFTMKITPSTTTNMATTMTTLRMCSTESGSNGNQVTGKKKRILSGVQPTGSLHLGNYLGAIRQWYDIIFHLTHYSILLHFSYLIALTMNCCCVHM